MGPWLAADSYDARLVRDDSIDAVIPVPQPVGSSTPALATADVVTAAFVDVEDDFVALAFVADELALLADEDDLDEVALDEDALTEDALDEDALDEDALDEDALDVDDVAFDVDEAALDVDELALVADDAALVVDDFALVADDVVLIADAVDLPVDEVDLDVAADEATAVLLVRPTAEMSDPSLRIYERHRNALPLLLPETTTPCIGWPGTAKISSTVETINESSLDAPTP